MNNFFEARRIQVLCGITVVVAALLLPGVLLYNTLRGLALGAFYGAQNGFRRSAVQHCPSRDALQLLFRGLLTPQRAIAMRDAKGAENAGDSAKV